MLALTDQLQQEHVDEMAQLQEQATSLQQQLTRRGMILTKGISVGTLIDETLDEIEHKNENETDEKRDDELGKTAQFWTNVEKQLTVSEANGEGNTLRVLAAEYGFDGVSSLYIHCGYQITEMLVICCPYSELVMTESAATTVADLAVFNDICEGDECDGRDIDDCAAENRIGAVMAHYLASVHSTHDREKAKALCMTRPATNDGCWLGLHQPFGAGNEQ